MLLGGPFRAETCTLALSMLQAAKAKSAVALSPDVVESHLTSCVLCFYRTGGADAGDAGGLADATARGWTLTRATSSTST